LEQELAEKTTEYGKLCQLFLDGQQLPAEPAATSAEVGLGLQYFSLYSISSMNICSMASFLSVKLQATLEHSHEIVEHHQKYKCLCVIRF